MPRKSLHGRTCGVSRDGGRARALQPSSRYTAPPLIYRTLQAPMHNAASNRDLHRWRRLGVISGLNQKLGSQGRDALTTSGTRRESIHGDSLAASMPPRVPEPVRTSRLLSWSCADATAKPR
ncbi:hypothetical protein XarjCFBP1022_01075 [Xanthomonas arboricola]|nr:hypothetical protein XarjCFBP1022_01075 [Xanthomonas arboricola]